MIFMIIDRKFYFYPLFNWLRNIKNFIYSVSSRSNGEFYISSVDQFAPIPYTGGWSVKKCDRMVVEDDRIGMIRSQKY